MMIKEKRKAEITCARVKIKRVEHNPYAAMSKEMLLGKLEKSRLSASQGNYRSADAIIADTREKYEL